MDKQARYGVDLTRAVIVAAVAAICILAFSCYEHGDTPTVHTKSSLGLLAHCLEVIGAESKEFCPKDFVELRQYILNKRMMTDSQTLAVDRWGTPFQLSIEGQRSSGRITYRIISGGPDRKVGTSDDLSVAVVIRCEPAFPTTTQNSEVGGFRSAPSKD